MQGLFRRRHLPHLDVPGGTYFVTFCLAGSLPASGALAAAGRNRTRLAPTQTDPPSHDWPGRAGDAFVDLDRLLDEAPMVRWLADARLADLVRRTLLHGHGSRYALHAYVVMPSHCHVVFTPCQDEIGGRTAREAIMHSIKRHAAFHGNRLLGRRGRFWQDESFDRLVRGPTELENAVAYVEHNPVKAGLCRVASEWTCSSAHTRPPAFSAG